MDEHQLLLTQLAVECIGLTADGLLTRIPGQHPDGIPRFYITRMDTGCARYFRDDVPRDVRQRLAALPLDVAWSEHAEVCRVLAALSPCEGVWRGVSYTFPADLAAVDHPDVVPLGPTHRDVIEAFDPEMLTFGWPVYAVLVEGRIASTCVSARENELAGEAWVQTHPSFRHRGYARQVTAAWGDALLRRGKIPLYSHSDDNIASARVARSLKLRPYLRDVGYM